MTIKHALILCSLFASVPAWAVNKCIDADGKAVFQDAPCVGKGEKIVVRPASGAAPILSPAASPSQTPQPTSGKAPIKATPEGAFGSAWQRRTYLENRGVADARGALQAHLNSCDAKQKELASKKNLARNNLAGATWEQSISSEMQAAATVCDSRARDLRQNLDQLEKELRELQASK